ncbi:MAG: dihydrolipoyl dehydrogenase, partial [Planctomycetota bacterium]
VVYADPEIAGAGLTEAEARARGVDVAVARMPLGANGRFLAETEGERGTIKVVAERSGQRLLGIHIAAPNASEMIAATVILIEQGLSIPEIQRIVFPHPTISECIGEAMRNADFGGRPA